MAVYAERPVCGGAKRELARSGRSAGGVRVRVVCLERVEGPGRLDLAAIGANARRASEDSASVAYLAAPRPAAIRFSRPILESAQIPQLTNPSGAAAMKKLLQVVDEVGDSTSLRQSILDQLQ